MGYFPLSSWFLKSKSVDAQLCMKYFLVSHAVNPDCGADSFLISQVTAGPGAYGDPYNRDHQVALCVGP